MKNIMSVDRLASQPANIQKKFCAKPSVNLGAIARRDSLKTLSTNASIPGNVHKVCLSPEFEHCLKYFNINFQPNAKTMKFLTTVDHHVATSIARTTANHAFVIKCASPTVSALPNMSATPTESVFP